MTIRTLASTSVVTLSLVAVSSGAAQAEKDWQYAIKPYGWYVWFDGDTGTDGNPPISSDNDLLDILDGFFLIQGEARRGKLSLLGEFNWVTLSDDLSVGPLAADWDLEGYMFALGAGYAVYEEQNTRVELTGGIRYWDVDLSTSLGPVSGSASTTITDPFVGFRVATPINDTFTFHAQGSVGVAGDSDNQFDIGAEVRWQWLERTDVAVGYRHLELDFDKDAVLVDASLYGPYAALNFRF